MPEDDYCWTCGGDHPTSTHEFGRVIKVSNTLAETLALDRALYGFSVETSEGERVPPYTVRYVHGVYEIDRK